MYSLGIDIGSSAVKVSIFEAAAGRVKGAGQYPDQEMEMIARQPGWAEQEPEWWWAAFLKAYQRAAARAKVDTRQIQSIGIAYQMHGLVCLDKAGKPVRPSIIWCDSRAVPIGQAALEALGQDYAFNHLLNSPGNFTASKLKWVKDHEPALFATIDKVCLPGDYLAYRLTGELTTTVTGLSEGIFYDFKAQGLSTQLLAYYGLSADLLPEARPSFANHGQILDSVAGTLELSPSAAVCYKAGDQPNNALSLNVLQPGEMAATAGTSGVVYGVSDELFVDYSQRVNSFAHVNYAAEAPRIGILLCINGTGIANAWARSVTGAGSYAAMNEAAAGPPPGSAGLTFFPFGNGAERMLGNQQVGSQLRGLNFNIHQAGHLYRAVQEGIAYAFVYGMEAFSENNIELKVVRAGYANMFLSPLFGKMMAAMSGLRIELYDTDGAAGAARGALIGGGHLGLEQAFAELPIVQVHEPDPEWAAAYQALYPEWKRQLVQLLNH